MARYTVRFNYHTYVEIAVNADSEKEALEKAEVERFDSKYNRDLLANIQEDGDPEITNDGTGWEESPDLKMLATKLKED